MAAGIVLIADDDSALRESLGSMLEQRGYESLRAGTCAEALSAARLRPPDVALVDIRLPGRSGVELLAELGRACPECTRIVLTACADAEAAVAGLREGAFQILQKPVRPEDLLQLLERAVETSRLRQEKRQAEEALRQRDATLRSILRAAPIGIGLVHERIIKHVNDRLCEMTGYQRDELINRDARMLYAATEDYEYVGREKYAQIRARGTGTVETRWRCKDGTVLDILLSSTPLDPDDLAAGVTFSALDITERKHAEQALRASEQNYRELFDSLDDAVFVHDADTARILDVNRGACEMLGHTRAEILERTIADLSPAMPDYAMERVREKVTRTRELGPQFFEWQATRKDGRVIPVEVNLKRAIIGGQARVLAAARDITKRKQVEQEQRRSAEFLQLVMNSIPQHIFWKDRDSVYLGCNENFAHVAGVHSPNNIVGKTDYDLAWQRHEADFFRECDRRVMERNAPEYHIIEPQQQAGGKQAWVDTNKVPLHDADGNVIGILGTYEDITERRLAEEALRNSEQLLRQAQETAHVGSYSRNFETNEVVWSDEQYRIFGYEPGEIVPTFELVCEHVHPDDRGRFVAANEAFATRAEPYDLEYRIVRRDGAVRMVHSRSITEGESAQPPRQTGALQDITEQRRAEQEREKLETQLRQAQKMEAIGQLAGGVAHDFNNILTAIFGNVGLALDRLKPKVGADDPLLQGLLEIERAAQRAATLTRQLLAFSRRQVSQPEVLDLNRTVEEMEKMLHRLLTEPIALETILAPDLLRIRADAGQIEQVIVNLVVNARDSMPEGGRLTVETSNVTLAEAYRNGQTEGPPGEYVLLAVSDTGCGMDPGIAERVFEPFFTTKAVGAGTGLGLAMVYGIVKQAKGHITVYSEPGKGTTFRIYLPAVTAQALEPRVHQANDDSPTGTETILVCEDDESVRGLAVQMLRDAGYTVMAADCGRAAVRLAAACEDRIHLLVTDIIMPDMNGKRLAEALGTEHAGLKTLFMSGYTSSVIAHHGVLDENVQFLEKPFTRRALLRRVREVLDK
ncbi:MAG: PAS domain S-box protein [Planctomycetes bacterium]|nr:PAS domain S-box protein [Planctomycetota bacterium]